MLFNTAGRGINLDSSMLRGFNLAALACRSSGLTPWLGRTQNPRPFALPSTLRA